MAIKNLETLIEYAKKNEKKKMVVVAPHSLDVVQAIIDAENQGLVDAILVGDCEVIKSLYCDLEAEPDIIHEPDEKKAAQIAVELVKSKKADMIMKGKIQTADLVRPVLNKERGIRTRHLLSQVVVFEAPNNDRLMMLTDAAINISPTVNEKVQICSNAITVAHSLGIDMPKVALLAAFEFVNPAMPATIDAACITQMNRRGQIEGALIDGPIALDAVISPKAAKQKKISSPIVGQTDILVAPDIEAANILYRAILYFAGARSCGIVYGAQVPLVLLSRAEDPYTKLCSIALASLVDHFEKNNRKE
jgi:phosphate butyryltransferase